MKKIITVLAILWLGWGLNANAQSLVIKIDTFFNQNQEEGIRTIQTTTIEKFQEKISLPYENADPKKVFQASNTRDSILYDSTIALKNFFYLDKNYKEYGLYDTGYWSLLSNVHKNCGFATAFFWMWILSWFVIILTTRLGGSIFNILLANEPIARKYPVDMGDRIFWAAISAFICWVCDLILFNFFQFLPDNCIVDNSYWIILGVISFLIMVISVLIPNANDKKEKLANKETKISAELVG